MRALFTHYIHFAVVFFVGAAEKLDQKKKIAKDERRVSTGSSSADGEFEEVEDPMLQMLKQSKESEKAMEEASQKRAEDLKRRDDREKAQHEQMMSALGAQTGAIGLLAATLQQNQDKTTTALGSISESLNVQSNALAMLIRNQQPNHR